MPSLIHSPAPNIDRSSDYYQKLGFQKVIVEDRVYFTDQQLTIYLNQDPFARTGIQLFKKDWSAIISVLSESRTVKNFGDGHLVVDPNGVFVYLLNEAPNIKKPDHQSILGNFAGLSLESQELDKSIHFWNLLGFKLVHGGLDQGWLSLSNEDSFTVSLMQTGTCPHLFINPSLTFFNGKENPAIIQKVRDNELPIFQEITHFNKEGLVDNIILQDPGGYGMFIFND